VAAAAKGVVATVMASIDNLQEVLARVKASIDAAEAEGSPAGGGAGQCWVHSGFLTAYDSVRPAVLGLVDTVLAGEEGEAWTVLLTGHSLGGALATLAAYDLSLRRWTRRPRVAMYNFGSPRVGNRVFAAEFNARVPDAWRVVNRSDAVCTVPRLMG
jgi:predicted lipase